MGEEQKIPGEQPAIEAIKHEPEVEEALEDAITYKKGTLPQSKSDRRFWAWTYLGLLTIAGGAVRCLDNHETTMPPSQVMTSPTVKAPAREDRNRARPAMSSGVPTRPRGTPAPIAAQSVPSTSPPVPTPVLKAEPLPPVIAPIVAAPAEPRTHPGVLQQTTVENESHGSGSGGGVGTGAGTGLGPGNGNGVGPGSGGGTGGGPYRPGSGIEAPQLLREVKADYTEDARQRGLSGDVVLEIVVRRDGSVGDIKILQGLGGGLNDRAVQAVRQWRFAPARRQGAAVDVIVEVAVEFKLR
jgi:TonB family protein